jgi:carbamoyl-phosphate synthase large subunit
MKAPLWKNSIYIRLTNLLITQTALLFAQCLNEKLPRKEGIPPEVRSWSEFTGGKLL